MAAVLLSVLVVTVATVHVSGLSYFYSSVVTAEVHGEMTDAAQVVTGSGLSLFFSSAATAMATVAHLAITVVVVANYNPSGGVESSTPHITYLLII